MADELDWGSTLAAEPPKEAGLTQEKRAEINEAAQKLLTRVDLKQRIEDRLKEVNQEINTLQHRTLPDLMHEAGVDKLGIPEDGVDLKLSPYYHANIPASWDDARRQAAFDYLEENGHGDLLSVEVSVRFGKKDLEKARALQRQLVDQGHIAYFKQSVPWNTYTAWLREQTETYNREFPLDLLGLTIGQIVKVSTRK